MLKKKRIYICLMWLILLVQFARADEPVVTLSVRNAPIEQVLLKIEEQVGLHVSFESSLLDKIPPVTLSVRDQTLSLCLYELFYKYEIEWIITGDYLILKRKGDTSFSARDTVKLISLQEFVVSADSLRHADALTGEPGKEILTGNTLMKIPTMLGQPDLIKGLQQLPGVAMGTEGLSGLYVRGGNNDENLFLIDNMPIYQVSHVGGLFSAFNPNAIDRLEFFKGFFPARYDGRLSSVTDIQTKRGDMKKYHGGLSIGLIQGNVFLEGPLIKDKLAFHFTMRRSWADLITAPTFAILNKTRLRSNPVNARYAFHDINARLDYIHSPKSQLTLGIYSGDDLFKMRIEDKWGTDSYDRYDYKIRWGNFATALTWKYRFSDKLQSKLVASYTRYRSKIAYSNAEKDTGKVASYLESKTISGIDDGRLSWILTYRPTMRHHITGGISARLQGFRPEYMEYKEADLIADDMAVTKLREQNKIRLIGNETILFLADKFAPIPHMTLDVGISFSSFYLKRKLYANLAPRVSLSYLFNQKLSGKLAYSRMIQPTHLVPSTYLELPTDIWLPSTKKVKPSSADQISAGLHYFFNEMYSAEMEIYFKSLNNLADFKPWVSRFPDSMGWEEKIMPTSGRAYGAEWIFRRDHERLGGWISYSLSWSDRFYDGQDGRRVRYPSRYDNRHKINIVATYRLSKKIELSAGWIFSKGNWMSLTPGSSATVPQLRKNNYQLPNYHRLDLGVNFFRRTKKGHETIWNVSIYNAYCRFNPIIAWPDDYDEQNKRIKVRQLGIFPIIPSFTYTYKF